MMEMKKYLLLFLCCNMNMNCVAQSINMVFDSETVVCKEENAIKRWISPIPSCYIDSVIYYSTEQLQYAESCFSFFYCRGGNTLAIPGFLSDVQMRSGSYLFCIHDLPCCGGNTEHLTWYQYNIETQVMDTCCIVWYYVPEENYNFTISKHVRKKIANTKYNLRSYPRVNDTEEDGELRQIGNVIDIIIPKTVFYCLGTITVKRQKWHIVAYQQEGNIPSYLIGWITDEEQ